MSSSDLIVTTAVHPLRRSGPSVAWWEARHAGGVLMLGDRNAILDVLTMGRIGVDVSPLQVGVSLREVTTFGKYLGGSPTNVAVAAARYGRRRAGLTPHRPDPLREYLHDALRGFGVDDRF